MIYYNIVLVIFFALLPHHTMAEKPHVIITCKYNGGRLGDNLLTYLHARWVSYQFACPLHYVPFPYSDHLSLHDAEQTFSEAILSELRPCLVDDVDKLEKNPLEPTLYILPYFPESHDEQLKKSKYIYLKVDWRNKEFKRMAKELIKPKYSLKLTKPPLGLGQGKTVAVHVRKGGGYDIPHVEKLLPHKFPPDSYYIQQIALLSRIFNHQPMYVHIFTDDPEPKKIVELYKKTLQLPNLIFGCREGSNSHQENVLEDFFSLFNFKCLIRPDSNFSYVAEKLGNFLFSISPASHHWEEDKLVIDAVRIERR